MILARVVGTVVATRKDPRLEGFKLLIVKPVSPEGKDEAGYVVAVDTVSAGVGERVRAQLPASCPVRVMSWRIRASASEILRLHQVANPVRASRDLLQNLQGKPNGCLARAVLPDQQEGRLTGDRQFEVLQATEIMNVEASHHNK